MTRTWREWSEPEAGRRYTRQQCIDAVIETARELGRTPSRSWWTNNHRRPSVPTIEATIGVGWAEVCQRANLTPNSRRTPRPHARKFTDRQLLDMLRTHAQAPDGSLGETGWKQVRAAYPELASPRAITSRFGSWAAALDAAGMPPVTRRRPRVPDAKIVAVVRVLAEQHGRLPSADVWDAQPQRLCPSSHVVTCFGSWRAMLAAAFADRPDDLAQRALPLRRFTDQETYAAVEGFGATGLPLQRAAYERWRAEQPQTTSSYTALYDRLGGMETLHEAFTAAARASRSLVTSGTWQR